MQSISELRAACAQLPHSRETFPFGPDTLVFKVAGKMYALSGITSDDLSLSLKVTPQHSEELRAQYSAVTQGYHLNKRHWISVPLSGALPDALVLDLLRGSYALVVAGLTRAQRAELSATSKEK